MVYTMVYTMVLQKSVRVNEKSGGFLGVPWYIPWYIPWNIPWCIPSCQRAFSYQSKYYPGLQILIDFGHQIGIVLSNPHLALVSGHFRNDVVELPYFHWITNSHCDVHRGIEPGEAAIEVSHVGQGIIEAALEQTAHLQFLN
jgi:hypothetical protein